MRALSRGVLLVVLGVSTAACTQPSAPPVPTAPSPAPTQSTPAPVVPAFPPPQNGVVISGLEAYGPFLLPGPLQKFQLTATRYVNGIPNDCTASAQWSSSNPDVLWFIPAPPPFGVIHTMGYNTGEAQITARCQGMSATITVRVDRYRLQGFVHQPNGQPISDADVVGSGNAARTDASGRFDYKLQGTLSINLMVSRPGFETVTVTREWDRTPVMLLDTVMNPVGVLILVGEDQLSNDRSIEREFRLQAPTTVRVDTFFSAYSCNFDDNCQVRTELYCNGTMVQGMTQDSPSVGQTAIYTRGLPECSYRLKFSAPLNGRFSFRFGVTVNP